MFQKIKDLFTRKKRVVVDFEKLPPELQKSLAEAIKEPELTQTIGDGNAEFLGEGTEEEWIAQQREDEGLEKWYKRWEL